MKFLTLTRIAALLATSGLASASIDDVCAGGVKLECDKGAVELLGSLDSMDPLEAFRSVHKFLESNCNGACLSSQLKAELCKKAHIIKPLIQEKIFLEDIDQCFSDTSAEEESCHVSYECPPGTPEGNICITNSCVSKGAAAAPGGPRTISAVKGDNCLVTYECPPGTPEGNFCVTEICDDSSTKLALEPPGKPKKSCLGPGAYVGYGDLTGSCRQLCCSGACRVRFSGRCYDPTWPCGQGTTWCEAAWVKPEKPSCLKSGKFIVAFGPSGPHDSVCNKCCSKTCLHAEFPCTFTELVNADICGVTACA